MNQYVYCDNDPINFFDPNGQDAIGSEIQKGVLKEDSGLSDKPELLKEITESMQKELTAQEIAGMGACKINPFCNMDKKQHKLGQDLADRVKKNKPELWDKYMKDKEQRDKAKKDSCKLK